MRLGELLAIPIALFTLKALTTKKEVETIAPLIPTKTVVDFAEFIPQTLDVFLLGGTKPTGPPITGEYTGLQPIGYVPPTFEPVKGLLEEFGGTGEYLKEVGEFTYDLPVSFDPWWKKEDAWQGLPIPPPAINE